MSNYSYLSNANPAFIEDIYKQYLKDPESVEEKWQWFFQGYELYENSKLKEDNFGENEGILISNKEAAIVKLIQAYRIRGHLIAKVNPLENKVKELETLKPEYFGFSKEDYEKEFNAGKDILRRKATLKEINTALNEIYCSKVGFEFLHCNDVGLRKYIAGKWEPAFGKPPYSKEKKIDIFKILSKAVIFENFLQTKYIGQKRFGLEGGEAIIPGLQLAINLASEKGVQEIIMGMAHRGRLNVLANILNKSYYDLFTEFEKGVLPEAAKEDGDVKYHLGQSCDIKINGKNMHLSLSFNPSHLEAVNTIVNGVVSGKCHKYYKGDKKKILPIIIHGDSAVSGQGVVYEASNLSGLKEYGNGGTIHLVINNQVGFTASEVETRSGSYCTDIAKVTDSPVFHVNGDDPIRLCYILELAVSIRQKFNIDVWVEVVCYRRMGHNETDDPFFTQPLLYKKIKEHLSVDKVFKEELKVEEIIDNNFIENFESSFRQELEEHWGEAKKANAPRNVSTLKRFWGDIRKAKQEDFEESIGTKVSKKRLQEVVELIWNVPEDFNIYPKAKKILSNRQELFKEKETIDWAMAEQLAYATLLEEGKSVRISGQDSGRGTFSHRHAILKDIQTNESYIPLKRCAKEQATFKVINSPLSEYSVLGFEYGYSLARPHALVIWEAQFGDFANCAQVIIDQFISSGETKWRRHSGLVMLLPHGYEGMGPEHSSARIERFLQMAAENNYYIVNITTPANFFHVLRRQLKNPFRKPLVVMSPKSLLRHPKVLSNIDSLVNDKFQEVIDEKEIEASKCTRVLVCTGKIYYDLLDFKIKNKIKNVAIVRLEQIYPIPRKQLLVIQKKYVKTKLWIWVQEEPRNMGCWWFVRNFVGFDFKVVSRKYSASPASGVLKRHQENQKHIVELSFKHNFETKNYAEWQ